MVIHTATDQPHGFPRRLEPHRHLPIVIGDHADPTDRRRWQNPNTIGFIVQTDISRNHRKIQCPAGLGHALDAADELPHDLGALGIAEVHAIGDRQRFCAHCNQVAPRLRHRLPAAFDGIGKTVSRRTIGGDRQRFPGAVHPHHRGIAAGPLHRVGADHMVVLFPDPPFRGEIGACHQPQQIGADIHRCGHIHQFRPFRRRHPGPVVFGRLASKLDASLRWHDRQKA